MRLFRRRNEDVASASPDADNVSRLERDTLDDNNYQTVKAVPAMAVVSSPKVHKTKGQLTFPLSLLLNSTRHEQRLSWQWNR